MFQLKNTVSRAKQMVLRAKCAAPRGAHVRPQNILGLILLCVLPVYQTDAQEPADAVGAEVQVEEPAASAPPTAAQEPNQSVVERLAEQQRQLLHDLKGPPTAIWLSVDDKQILAFWQPDRSGKPVGAILMLHDEGENPRRAATLQRLHEYLPPHGWATFSVELPDLPPASIPARPVPPAAATAPHDSLSTETPDADAAVDGSEVDESEVDESEVDESEVDESAVDESAVDESEVVHQEAAEETPPDTNESPLPPTAPAESREVVIEHIHRRIKVATAYLHQQGQYNLVLLGEGSSAYWALQHLNKATPPPSVESTDRKSKGIIDRTFRAVVLLNPRAPTDGAFDLLHDELSHPEIPTFDVFTDFHLETLTAARNRHQTAKQKGYENYIVRRLPPPSGADPERTETLLTKAIRGFLQKYAQGVELK